MLHLLHLHTPLDPLHGDGYQWWSGLGSGSPIFVAIALWWRHHNCHVHRCPRLSWHPHPTHGHPVCRRHHPRHRRALPGQHSPARPFVGWTKPTAPPDPAQRLAGLPPRDR